MVRPHVNLGFDLSQYAPRTKTNLVRGYFGWPVNTDDGRMFVGYLKLFRFMSVKMMPNKMQIKQRAELFLTTLYSEQRN